MGSVRSGTALPLPSCATSGGTQGPEGAGGTQQGPAASSPPSPPAPGFPVQASPSRCCMQGWHQLGPLADVLPLDVPEGALGAASLHGTVGLGQVEAGGWSIFCHLQAAGQRGSATAHGGKEKQGWLCSVPPPPWGDFTQRFSPDAPAHLVLLQSLHGYVSAFQVLFLQCWTHPKQAIPWERAHTFGALLAPWGAGSWSGGRVVRWGAW